MDFINASTVVGIIALVLAGFALARGNGKLSAAIGAVAVFALLTSLFQPATQTALSSAAGNMITGLFSALTPK